jgi:hypothetical protein
MQGGEQQPVRDTVWEGALCHEQSTDGSAKFWQGLTGEEAGHDQEQGEGEWLTDNRAGKAGRARAVLRDQSNKTNQQWAKNTTAGL